VRESCLLLSRIASGWWVGFGLSQDGAGCLVAGVVGEHVCIGRGLLGIVGESALIAASLLGSVHFSLPSLHSIVHFVQPNDLCGCAGKQVLCSGGQCLWG